MCGVVCFYGKAGGMARVLRALDLLAYRAPDSCGLALIGEDGALALRRTVGTSDALRAKIATQPLTASETNGAQVVVGHGRWAMVGAVTEANAHPLFDRSLSRLACENGSHNATLMLEAMAAQERWWREQGLPSSEPVHRSQNTTEVLAFEWERVSHLLAEGKSPPGSRGFLKELDKWDVLDLEERALRLAAWHLREGNAHACAFYGRRQPETLYVTSHHKPIAIASRQTEDGHQELMVASDVNAALALWPSEVVETAAARIAELQEAVERGSLDASTAQAEIEAISERFTVKVIFLDSHLDQGRELFVRIANKADPGGFEPEVAVSRYDGMPLAVQPLPLQLNPAMVGKQEYPTFTESHIAEIPGVLDTLLRAYTRDNRISLEAVKRDGRRLSAGLNIGRLRGRSGRS